ncbi:MAG: hypothetical protein FWE36_00525 [Erysipelotrichales bacterium]|nr:hypothetical protein [Erysipelotrichales bacterium]
MNKQKKIVILLLLLLGSIGVVFGFWFSAINSPDNETGDGSINVGTARPVDTVIDVNDATSNQTLVPIGTSHLSQGSVVEFIDLTFNVRWEEELGLGQTTGANIIGVLHASLVVNSITLNSSVHHLVNIDFLANHAVILEGSAVAVVVRVTLNRPANQAEYLLLANQAFSFTMHFSVMMTSATNMDELFALAWAEFDWFDNLTWAPPYLTTSSYGNMNWITSHPSILNWWHFARPFTDTMVTITAEISINGETRTRTWNYLALGTFLGTRSHGDGTTGYIIEIQEMNLGHTESYGFTIRNGSTELLSGHFDEFGIIGNWSGLWLGDFVQMYLEDLVYLVFDFGIHGVFRFSGAPSDLWV